MKNIITLKTLILAAAVSLGLSATALAQDGTQVPNPAAGTSHGLLGQSYAIASYSYINNHGTDIDAHAYDFTLNQNVRDGIDALMEYDYTNSESLLGGRDNHRMIDAGVRAYTITHGFKPFVEAGLGWIWEKAPFGYRANSAAYFVGTGAEFQVTKDFSVTPLVRFTDGMKRDINHKVTYGVKANYWLSERVGLTADVLRDNHRDMQYTLGVSLRY